MLDLRQYIEAAKHNEEFEQRKGVRLTNKRRY